jgi:SAM-dependent methyltransferase
MRYSAAAHALPFFLRRHILHFECEIEKAVQRFAAGLPEGALVLDAGAGESQYARAFARQRYVAADLAVGDPNWDYRKLDCIADLSALPFRSCSFDAALNIVTLEHVREPVNVMEELARSLKPGGRLLLIVPHEWEVHQPPYDYYRYTRYGIAYLLERSGLRADSVRPVGGYFRLLARRLLNGLQFFIGGSRWIVFLPAAALLVPPALLLPLLDFLDKERNFTLGYICTATKPR